MRFFYSLISLFQLPQEQQFKNALGLYGELKIIEYFYNNFEKDISPYWHKSGSSSKNDFTLEKLGLEVKTILSEELIVTIKHSQLLNNRIFLCVVNCEKNDVGETLKVLSEKLIKNSSYCNGYNFNLALTKELKRISNSDFLETTFNVLSINIYDAAKINPFSTIPDDVTKLIYDYDLNGKNTVSEKIITEVIKNV